MERYNDYVQHVNIWGIHLENAENLERYNDYDVFRSPKRKGVENDATGVFFNQIMGI